MAICGTASRLRPETCNAVGAGITCGAYDGTAASRSRCVDCWFVRTLCARGGPGLRSFVSVDPPDTCYARSGDLSIAYQVIGEGPLDLVYTGSWTNP